MASVFLIILFLLFLGGMIYNSIRTMSHTYDKEIRQALRKDGNGWELVSVRHSSSEEYYESPYHSFFKFTIGGMRSTVLVATIHNQERTIELWVQVHTFMFWVTSLDYETKKNKRELTQEQW